MKIFTLFISLFFFVQNCYTNEVAQLRLVGIAPFKHNIDFKKDAIFSNKPLVAKITTGNNVKAVLLSGGKTVKLQKPIKQYSKIVFEAL